MKLANPLESVFGMESGTVEPINYEMIEKSDMPLASTEAPVDHKDEDDIETEKKIDEVYAAAITTFNNQMSYTEIIEPRYAARNAEVAANFLNIALAAANSKAKVKTDRKRANQAFVPYAQSNKTTNNVVIADRNQILKMLDIDGETKTL